jgi:hypothetical protein
MATFEIGKRVKFFRSHDKQNELTGKIMANFGEGAIPDDSALYLIETEPDGKRIEVSSIETAHVSDITPIEEEATTGGEAEAPAPKRIRRARDE